MTSVEEIVPLLNRVSLFSTLPQEDLERLVAVGEEQLLPAGTLLFEEGEDGDTFYAVISGAVEIFRKKGDGTPERLAIRRGGDAFGEMALLENAPRSASARTLEESRLLLLNREGFHTIFDPNTPAARMLATLSRSLRALDVRFTARDRGAGIGEGLRHFNSVLRQGLLPRTAPNLPGFQVAAGSSLVDGGSGDTLWDAFPQGGGGTVLAILRVRGEGWPPAHLLGVTSAVLRAVARTTETPDALLREANETLVGRAVGGVDQHVECALIRVSGSSIGWSSAGQPPAVLLRIPSGVEELTSFGPPLGMMSGFSYGARTLSLAPGESLLALSHGTLGLMRGAADLVAARRGESPSELVGKLQSALARAHSDGSDSTVILLRRDT